MGLLKSYVDNSRDVYAFTEVLINQVAKRFIKGRPVDASHLAACSTMCKLIGCAARVMYDDEGVKPTTAERRAAKTAHAAYIIESAKYLATA